MKKDYCPESADNLLESFKELTGFDYSSSSQKNKDVYLRALSYKILIELNFMNDRQVSEYLTSKGVHRNRSSIYHALSKIDMYYTNFSNFRKPYDLYFTDMGIKRKATIEEKEIKIRKDAKEVYNNNPNTLPDRLKNLVDGIPEDRREEVYEMLNLRVKSWDWKSKNEYEIIEGASGIGNSTWNQ